jgi:hypothetical protein
VKTPPVEVVLNTHCACCGCEWKASPERGWLRSALVESLCGLPALVTALFLGLSAHGMNWSHWSWRSWVWFAVCLQLFMRGLDATVALRKRHIG